MLFHIFRHVETSNRRLVIEQELGQRLVQFGLANTRGPQEQERTDRAVRIFQTRPRPAHSIGHSGQGFILTDHAAAQHIFHAQQLVAFAFQHLVDRNAGPA